MTRKMMRDARALRWRLTRSRMSKLPARVRMHGPGRHQHDLPRRPRGDGTRHRRTRVVISVQLPSRWQFVTLVLACTRLGRIVNPMMPSARGRDLQTILGLCGPSDLPEGKLPPCFNDVQLSQTSVQSRNRPGS